MELTVTVLTTDDIAFGTPLEVSDEVDSRYQDRHYNETIGEAKVHHYTGFDHGRSKGGRTRRPTATPEFEVWIRLTEDDEPLARVATIVANAMPDTGTVAPGEPVAIAKVALTEDDYNDDSRWYLLISSTHDADGLTMSPQLVSYDGEPEELFAKTYLFDEE